MKTVCSVGALTLGLIAVGAWGSLRGAATGGPAQQIAELKQSVDQLQARVRTLEQRVEKLEALKTRTVQIVPAPNPPPVEQGSVVRVPRPEPVPKNWQPFEFNGMTYYLVPLRQ